MREGRRQVQAPRQEDGSVEGLECLVLPITSQPRIRKLSVPRRGMKTGGSKHHRNETYQESAASSGGSNNELSTLLPNPMTPGIITARRDVDFSSGHQTERNDHGSSPIRHCRLKRTARINRRSQTGLKSNTRKNQREAAIATTLSAGHGTHCAKSFNDTSDGSVHCFLDEHGNWVTYTFDEKGLGTANLRILSVPAGTNAEDPPYGKGNSSISVALDAPVSTLRGNGATSNSMIPVHDRLSTMINETRSRLARDTFDPMPSQALNFLRHDLREVYFFNTHDNDTELKLPRNRFRIIRASDTLNNNYPKTKAYYKFKVLPWTYVKVTFDRLKLLALLDRNLTIVETLLSIVLGVAVSVLGAVLLYLGLYDDLLAFTFCFVIASCQYSLLKSVQPDAASPTHGFNRIIAYSRPVYFVIFTAMILFFHHNIPSAFDASLEVYGVSVKTGELLLTVRDFLSLFVLFFPFLFSLGLFPQINTFLLYFLEQVDMHVFGGNAMPSLVASFYCIFRSVLAVLVAFVFAYLGLSEPKLSQHLFFSVFCAILVPMTYHLSRSASDPSHVWNIVRKNVWPPDIYREHRRNLDKIKEGVFVFLLISFSHRSRPI